MFDALFSAVRDRTRQFTVYTDEPTEVEGLFANHDVDVVHRTVPTGGPDPFLVLNVEGEFAGAIALADLDGLLEPPIARPGERDHLSKGYRVLFDVLDEQVSPRWNAPSSSPSAAKSRTAPSGSGLANSG